MPITDLFVSGYRSVRDVWLKLDRVNVLIGANGCGKTNLYRGMYLIWAAAAGQFARALAEEGGMPSVLWAGSRMKGEKARLSLCVKIDDLKYRITCGIPIPTQSMFNLDPDIKEEHVWYIKDGRKLLLLRREHALIEARNESGKRINFPLNLSGSESVLSALREPHRFPELSRLRESILRWRFYHQFRTDPLSPIREPQVGVRTNVLSHDGRDLAAALQTIREIGDSESLYAALEEAFPGSSLVISENEGRFRYALHMPDFQRAFGSRELSDGTVQYLCLLAALLSPRPPNLLALNEPETSIHPDLLRPLAKLITQASSQSQLWITTHSRELADEILECTGVSPIELQKVEGETHIVGCGLTNDDDA